MWKRNKNKNNIEVRNVVESISKAKPLYIKLIKLSHPDKYTDTTKFQLAEEITSALNENRFSYSELKKIEKRILNELI